jgi:hypothetical protein
MTKMPFAEHDNVVPAGSNRSPFHNIRSATAIAARLADSRMLIARRRRMKTSP